MARSKGNNAKRTNTNIIITINEIKKSNANITANNNGNHIKKVDTNKINKCI